ncbi:MAG TPA: hypothetical protein VF838_01745 [Trebonia sp.]
MRRSTAGRGGVVLGIAALVLAGCGTAATGTGPGSVATSQPSKAGGWAVRGTFKMEGGPERPGAAGAPVRPLPGTVTFRAASGRTTDLRAGPAGQFSGYLPAGTYTVTARTELIMQQNPDGSVSDPPCTGPVTVVVRPGQATSVALVCFVP